MVSVIIKPIVPKSTVIDLEKIIQTEKRREVVNVKRELALPTRRWKHKVQFYEEPIGDNVKVGTDDKPYQWTDKGTPAHIIKVKKAPFLKFKRNFRAKTVPDNLTSRAGASSPPWVSKKLVKHPGTKARHFTRLVLKRSRPRFKRNMDKAIRLAVARANKG